MRPSRSRMSRVLTMPGWTQFAVTLASISWSCSASALVWSTLASLDSAYARVGSYGLERERIQDNQGRSVIISISVVTGTANGRCSLHTTYIFLRVTRSRYATASSPENQLWMVEETFTMRPSTPVALAVSAIFSSSSRVSRKCPGVEGANQFN
jgi:hypothetical protein